jgi:hypothetical protein
LFRKFAIAHLKRLRRAGKLNFGGSLEYLRKDDEWESLLDDLASVAWVSHIEPPRNEQSRGEHVVDYLTRYLTGGPISDERITAADEQNVTFMAREGKAVGGERRQVPYTLSSEEFVRRWCLHIQPTQLTKSRCFGGWSNTRSGEYLERCSAALQAAGLTSEEAEPSEIAAANFLGEERESDRLVCEHCGSGSLRLIKQIDKPSWKSLLHRDAETCPVWYSTSLWEEHRRFWTAAEGVEFYEWYAWYLKSGLESARERVTEPGGRATQLSLPGLEESGNYETHSF